MIQAIILQIVEDEYQIFNQSLKVMLATDSNSYYTSAKYCLL